MDKFYFWYKWLLFVTIFMILFGVTLCIANGTIIFSWMDIFYTPFYGSSAPSTAEVAFKGWTYNIVGSLMAGWSVMMTFVIVGPFRRRESWTWAALTTGLLVWYILDTSMSVYFGVFANVVLNTVFLSAFLPPLIATRRCFT